MAEVTIGDSLSLIIKIPSKGDTNWAEKLRVNCWQKIAAHDHTGGGKGAQITSGALANLSISTAKLQDDAVTADKISPGAVESSKIAFDAVNSTHIADDQIGEEHIKDSAVRKEHIHYEVAGAGLIQNSINNALEVKTGTGLTISADTVQVAALGITSGLLADNSVDTFKLQSDFSNDANRAVSSSHIKTGAVTIDKLEQSVINILTYAPRVITIYGTTDAAAYSCVRGDTVIIQSAVPVTLNALDCARVIVRGTGALTIDGNVTGCVIQTLNDEHVTVKGSVIGSVINVGGWFTIDARASVNEYIDECQINAERLTLQNYTGSNNLYITNSDIKCNILHYYHSGIIVETSTFMRGSSISGGGNVTLGAYAFSLPSLTDVQWTINSGVFKADLIFEAIPSASFTVNSTEDYGDCQLGSVVVNTNNKFSASSNLVTVPCDGVYSVQLMQDVSTTTTNTPATLRLMIEHSGGYIQDVGNMSHKPALGAGVDASVFANVSMDVTLNAYDTIKGMWRYWGPGGTANYERAKLIIKYLGSL